MKENDFALKKTGSRWHPTETITHTDNKDNLYGSSSVMVSKLD